MIVRTPIGDIAIDDESGEASTEVEALAAAAADASAAVLGGYVEPWRPPLQVLYDWATREGVAVEVFDQPDDWPALPPGAVAGPLRPEPGDRFELYGRTVEVTVVNRRAQTVCVLYPDTLDNFGNCDRAHDIPWATAWGQSWGCDYTESDGT